MYLKNTPQNQWSNASPMQMSLPLEIPDTYIEAAEFDCLRDDSVSYASRLQNAGGKVTFIQTYGTVHGYDIVQNLSLIHICTGSHGAVAVGKRAAGGLHHDI